MENLTPRTREEEFLKGAAEGGTDLIPLPDVRREAFLKRLSDPTYPRPEGTKTREEWFLDQAAKGGGGSITVEELDVTENGTYTAPAMTAYNPVNVNVPLPENALLLKDIPSTPTAIATFSDGAEMVMPSLTVGVDAWQDLHGYDAPWVGGAGKNKLPMTVSGIKSDNTSGTWNGNVFTHNNGVTFTIETDTDNNVTGIKANGTASGECNFYCGTYIATGVQTSAKGCPSDGSLSTYRMFTTNIGSDVGNGVTSTPASGAECTSRIIVYGGQTVSNLLFKPIIFYASETVTSFEPYSNICPISGWDECNVSVSGVNAWDEEWEVGDINSNGVPVSASDRIRSKNFIPVKPNTTYYLKCPTINARIVTYDNNKNFVEYYSSGINNTTFTVGSNVYYIKFYMFPTYGTTYNNDISINYPSTDTDYHAYNGQITTIDLNGTRYGGRLEIVNGVARFVADRASVDMGNLTYNESDDYLSLFKDTINTVTGNNPKRETTAFIMCSAWGGNTFVQTNNSYRFITDMSASDFKTAMTGQTLCYELAEPIIIPLSPTPISTIEGENNLFADSGEILEGEYLGGVS